jgi:hypothetical protein
VAEGVEFAPNTAGIALRVPHVAAARERLAGAGVEFLGETVPDGNVLILHGRIGRR